MRYRIKTELGYLCGFEKGKPAFSPTKWISYGLETAQQQAGAIHGAEVVLVEGKL